MASREDSSGKDELDLRDTLGEDAYGEQYVLKLSGQDLNIA